MKVIKSFFKRLAPVVLGLILIHLLGCKKEDTSRAVEKKESLDTIWIQTQLSQWIIDSPESSSEIEQNLILDYAINNLIQGAFTPSGLFFFKQKEGPKSEYLEWGDQIKVKYKGYFLSGKVFDQSKEEGMEIYVGNMIDGWNEALQFMEVGSKALIIVPSQLAYKEKGLSKSKGSKEYLIPPNSTLAFEIEVLELLNKKKGQ